MPNGVQGARAAERGFPLCVAAVDIGSNAIRFAAARFFDRSRHTQIHYRRVPVRLGHSAFLTGRLTGEDMDAAVEAMASFRRTADTIGLSAVRVVATSAVRESGNGGDLIARARRESGFTIETITGREEARLVWLAVRDRFPLEGRWILVDLGGGSLEVSVVRQSGIEWSESHPVGTVRLLEELGGTGPGSERQLRQLLAEYTRALRLPALDAGLTGLVATGGNIEALANLAEATRDENGVRRLAVEELKAVNRRLAELTYRQRVDEVALREDRADVIIPAGRVYERVAERAGATEIVVPQVGVKDGVLLDLVEELTRPGTPTTS